MSTVTQRRSPSIRPNSDSPNAAPVSARVTRNGEARVLTLNVHKFANTKDPHFSQAAVDDIVRFIKTQKADVVLFQEFGSRPDKANPTVEARNVALLESVRRALSTPGKEAHAQFAPTSEGRYDSALVTRNGYTIQEGVAVPMRATNQSGNKYPRSIGVADVVAPDRKTHLNVVFAHASPGNSGHPAARKKQLQQLATVAKDLRDGRLDRTYEGQKYDFFSARAATTILGGDLNAGTATTDRFLARTLVNTLPGRGNGSKIREDGSVGGKIDHLYVSRGQKYRQSRVMEVPMHKTTAGRVTDHKAVLTTVAVK